MIQVWFLWLSFSDRELYRLKLYRMNCFVLKGRVSPRNKYIWLMVILKYNNLWLNSGKLHYPTTLSKVVANNHLMCGRLTTSRQQRLLVRNPIGNSPFRSQDQWEILRIHGINGATVESHFSDHIFFCGEFMAMKNHWKHQKINRLSHSNFLLVEMVAFMTRKINFDPRHMCFYPKKTGRDFMNLTQNDIFQNIVTLFCLLISVTSLGVTTILAAMWVCLKIVYPYTQWLMIIIPTKWF